MSHELRTAHLLRWTKSIKNTNQPEHNQWYEWALVIPIRPWKGRFHRPDYHEKNPAKAEAAPRTTRPSHAAIFPVTLLEYSLAY